MRFAGYLSGHDDYCRRIYYQNVNGAQEVVGLPAGLLLRRRLNIERPARCAKVSKAKHAPEAHDTAWSLSRVMGIDAARCVRDDFLLLMSLMGRIIQVTSLAILLRDNIIAVASTPRHFRAFMRFRGIYFAAISLNYHCITIVSSSLSPAISHTYCLAKVVTRSLSRRGR